MLLLKDLNTNSTTKNILSFKTINQVFKFDILQFTLQRKYIYTAAIIIITIFPIIFLYKLFYA